MGPLVSGLPSGLVLTPRHELKQILLTITSANTSNQINDTVFNLLKHKGHPNI
jgi:hypothetical protein